MARLCRHSLVIHIARIFAQLISKISVTAKRTEVTWKGYRYNPVIKKFYDKLIAKGKIFKVAITAVMRKILVILNTMVRFDQKWKFAT